MAVNIDAEYISAKAIVLGIGLFCFSSISTNAQVISQDNSRISSECASELTAVNRAYMENVRTNNNPNSGFRSSGIRVWIPVQHHIVRASDGSGGLKSEEAESIIDTLNYFFKEASIQFYSCGSINEILSDEYFELQTTEETALASANEVSGTLNIYYVDELKHGSIGLCGYAYYPGSYDRIVLDKDCAINGNTIIHEMGHYFSLSHTHGASSSSVTNELVNGSNCSLAGDMICDTPADPGLNYMNVSAACNYTGSATDDSGMGFNPDTRNFMSYSRKTCRGDFTESQLNEIFYSSMFDRANLSCACHTPYGLGSSAQTNEAVISWTEVPSVISYQIAGRMKGMSGFVNLVHSGSSSRIVGGLIPNRNYEWKIRAKCADGTITDFSPLAKFATEKDSEDRLAVDGYSEEFRMSVISANPNPVSDLLYIELIADEDVLVKYELRNYLGERVFVDRKRATEGINRIVLDVSEHIPGLYYLRADIGGDKEMLKVVIRR
jgi:hypothetical protein